MNILDNNTNQTFDTILKNAINKNEDKELFEHLVISYITLAEQEFFASKNKLPKTIPYDEEQTKKELVSRKEQIFRKIKYLEDFIVFMLNKKYCFHSIEPQHFQQWSELVFKQIKENIFYFYSIAQYVPEKTVQYNNRFLNLQQLITTIYIEHEATFIDNSSNKFIQFFIDEFYSYKTHHKFIYYYNELPSDYNDIVTIYFNKEDITNAYQTTHNSIIKKDDIKTLFQKTTNKKDNLQIISQHNIRILQTEDSLRDKVILQEILNEEKNKTNTFKI